jgi:hypothetical protein
MFQGMPQQDHLHENGRDLIAAFHPLSTSLFENENFQSLMRDQ